MTDEADNKPKKPEPRRPGGKTKRVPNKWLLRIFRGYDAGGKRIYYSETFHGGSREADNRLTELKNRHKAGLPLKFEAKTFKDFFSQWLEDTDDGARRESTITHYRQMGEKYLLPAFGDFTLTDVTDIAVKRLYKKWREEGYAPATIGLLHVILSSLFKSAEDGDLVLRNPMRKVKAPPQEKPRPVAMNADETHAFFDAAARTDNGFMFLLAFHLGVRPGELLGLMWKDCDLKARRVSIRRTLKWRKAGDWYTTPPKTEKGIRDIPITPEMAKGLEDHRRRQLEMRLKAGQGWGDHGFVFTDECGEPHNFERVRRTHKKILADAGLPETFQLKVSRHTCASALLKAGVHPKIVSERLGHSSISITLDVYTSVEEDQQRAASEALGEMFGRGKK